MYYLLTAKLIQPALSFSPGYPRPCYRYRHSPFDDLLVRFSH
jgi:hypothetical protein